MVGQVEHTSQLVELQGEGYAEANELIGYRNEESDGQVVVVKNMNDCHECGFRRPIRSLMVAFWQLAHNAAIGKYGAQSSQT